MPEISDTDCNCNIIQLIVFVSCHAWRYEIAIKLIYSCMVTFEKFRFAWTCNSFLCNSDPHAKHLCNMDRCHGTMNIYKFFMLFYEEFVWSYQKFGEIWSDLSANSFYTFLRLSQATPALILCLWNPESFFGQEFQASIHFSKIFLMHGIKWNTTYKKTLSCSWDVT